MDNPCCSYTSSSFVLNTFIDTSNYLITTICGWYKWPSLGDQLAAFRDFFFLVFFSANALLQSTLTTSTHSSCQSQPLLTKHVQENTANG